MSPSLDLFFVTGNVFNTVTLVSVCAGNLFIYCYLFLFLSEIGVHSKVQIFVYLEFDFVVAAESECFNLHTQLYYWLK